jgi:hypothetical protein
MWTLTSKGSGSACQGQSTFLLYISMNGRGLPIQIHQGSEIKAAIDEASNDGAESEAEILPTSSSPGSRKPKRKLGPPVKVPPESDEGTDNDEVASATPSKSKGSKAQLGKPEKTSTKNQKVKAKPVTKAVEKVMAKPPAEENENDDDQEEAVSGYQEEMNEENERDGDDKEGEPGNDQSDAEDSLERKPNALLGKGNTRRGRESDDEVDVPTQKKVKVSQQPELYFAAADTAPDCTQEGQAGQGQRRR